MAFKDWSETAADNDDADAAINWAEGQAPSTVNGSARAMMAVLKTAFGHVVSAKDYGAVGDGSTDDTAAIHSAITAVKNAGGGKVYFAPGAYKCNLVITGERVQLSAVAFGYDANTSVGFVPNTLTSPVISIGDGTTLTRDIVLNGISLYGNNTGDKGLLVNGANDLYFNGFTSRAFEEYQVQLTSSATRSTFFVFFNNYHIATGTTAGSLGLDYNYGSTFTTAIYFSNGAWNATAGGSFLIDLDGSGAVLNLANTWVEADDDQGFNLGTGTKVLCSNVTVDSGSSADSLATVATNTSPSVYISGSVQIDGVMTMPGGDTVALTGRYLIPNEALMNNPHITGSMSFQDSNASAWLQTQTGNLNQRIARSGTTLILVSSDGDVRITSTTGLQLNGGSLRLTDGIAAPGATAGQAKIYVDTADGDLKVVFGDGVTKTLATDT